MTTISTSARRSFAGNVPGVTITHDPGASTDRPRVQIGPASLSVVLEHDGKYTFGFRICEGLTATELADRLYNRVCSRQTVSLVLVPLGNDVSISGRFAVMDVERWLENQWSMQPSFKAALVSIGPMTVVSNSPETTCRLILDVDAHESGK